MNKRLWSIVGLGVAKWAAIGAFVVASSGVLSWVTASGRDALSGKFIGVQMQRDAIARQTLTVACGLAGISGVAFVFRRRPRK